jgi:hypothetical protein
MTIPRKAAGVPDAAGLAMQTIQVSRDRGAHGPARQLAPQQLVRSDAASAMRTRRLADFRCHGQNPLCPRWSPRQCGSVHTVGRNRRNSYTHKVSSRAPRGRERGTAARAAWGRLGPRGRIDQRAEAGRNCADGREGLHGPGGTTLAASARKAPNRWGARNIVAPPPARDEETPRNPPGRATVRAVLTRAPARRPFSLFARTEKTRSYVLPVPTSIHARLRPAYAEFPARGREAGGPGRRGEFSGAAADSAALSARARQLTR